MQKPLLIVIPVAALAIIIGGYFLLGSGKNKTSSPADFDAIVNPPAGSLNDAPPAPFASSSSPFPSSSLPATGNNTSTLGIPAPIASDPAPIPTLPSPPSSTSSTLSSASTDPLAAAPNLSLPSDSLAPLTPATPIPGPTASAKTYKIQPGDTLATIAAKFLGSSAKWEELAKANPGVNPYNLKIGQVINLPSASMVPAHSEQGYDAAGPMTEDSAARRSPSSDVTTGTKTYLVKDGDTLWSIAQSHYGDGSKWSLILKANRRQLSDASKLKPGMKLVIPAGAANSDSAQ